jgi:hypothetical protein
MVLQAFGRRIGGPMRWCRREPTIAEMLSDPIVMAVMEADGVDPMAFEAQLKSMAQNAAPPRHAGQWAQPD